MNFTEMSEGLSMVSELPKVILSSRRDLNRGFVLRELPAYALEGSGQAR